jgi:hypothetical protein
VHIVLAFKPDDKPRRFQFAKDILSNVEADENFLRSRIFSDEATFYVSGRINHHNCRIWGSEDPRAIREIERDSAKVKVWGTLSCSEDHQPNVVFQQDGAPPHWARTIREFLDMDFLGAGVGVMGQFRDLRAHPILRRLISSCEDTLRILFNRPLLPPS